MRLVNAVLEDNKRIRGDKRKHVSFIEEEVIINLEDTDPRCVFQRTFFFALTFTGFFPNFLRDFACFLTSNETDIYSLECILQKNDRWRLVFEIIIITILCVTHSRCLSSPYSMEPKNCELILVQKTLAFGQIVAVANFVTNTVHRISFRCFLVAQSAAYFLFIISGVRWWQTLYVFANSDNNMFITCF